MEDLYAGGFEGFADGVQSFVRDYSMIFFGIMIVLIIYIGYTYWASRKDNMYTPGATALYRNVNWSENMDSVDPPCPAQPLPSQSFQQFAMGEDTTGGKWNSEDFSDEKLAVQLYK